MLTPSSMWVLCSAVFAVDFATMREKMILPSIAFLLLQFLGIYCLQTVRINDGRRLATSAWRSSSRLEMMEKKTMSLGDTVTQWAKRVAAVAIASTALQLPSIPLVQALDSSNNSPAVMTGYQTKSGLIYFDLEQGEGPTPKYGQLISFYYTLYYQLSPQSSLEVIDNPNHPFLHKHGNGRLIQAMDEALHTMQVGTKRRIIIPRELAYVKTALGPLPENPGPRHRLQEVLDLVDEGKGRLVADLDLIVIRDDENDQGYYDDIVATPEEMEELAKKFLDPRLDNIPAAMEDKLKTK